MQTVTPGMAEVAATSTNVQQADTIVVQTESAQIPLDLTHALAILVFEGVATAVSILMSAPKILIIAVTNKSAAIQPDHSIAIAVLVFEKREMHV